MRAIKVENKDAEALLERVKRAEILAKDYLIKRDATHIYIPVTKTPPASLYKPGTLTTTTFAKRIQRKNLKDALQTTLSPKEFANLGTAMDVVGTIAILEIEKPLAKKAKTIAQMLLAINPSIKTVLKKASEHKGIYRLQKYTYLAGKKTKETTHKENGIIMHLHVEKTYFSPRLSTDRLRIAHLIQPGENILVMFSGIAAYPLVFARNSPAKTITGVEINKDACIYAEENVRLNKFTNIAIHCGDVTKILPKLKQTYDRILMPLPHGAADYLPLARQYSTKKTIIHYYTFSKEEDLQQAHDLIEHHFPNAAFLQDVKCGQIKPHIWRYSIDFTAGA